MKRHPRVVAAVVVIATITVVSACAPEEAPKPTPTAAFASDEEAFAAAEETYRAYVDALNDDTGSADPMTYLTSDALEGALEGEQQRKALGLRLEGDIAVTGFRGTSWDQEVLESVACLDYSSTRVVSSSGADETPPDRATKASLDLEMRMVDARLLITVSSPSDRSC